MPFEVGEIVLHAQVIEPEANQKDGRNEGQGCGSCVEKMREAITAELRSEMKQLIRDELNRRARR